MVNLTRVQGMGNEKVMFTVSIREPVQLESTMQWSTFCLAMCFVNVATIVGLSPTTRELIGGSWSCCPNKHLLGGRKDEVPTFHAPAWFFLELTQIAQTAMSVCTGRAITTNASMHIRSAPFRSSLIVTLPPMQWGPSTLLQRKQQLYNLALGYQS